MSNNFHGRRAPNVSQYLANLNTIPSPHDVAAQQNELALGDEGLEFLTNAEFFDFDALNVDFHAQQARLEQQQQQEGRGTAGPQFGFQTYPPSMTGSPNSMQSFQGHYIAAGAPPPPPGALQSYPPHAVAPQTDDKRKSTSSLPPSAAADLEEQSRMAAEEDKRRRNTAASARFRVKKKQREAALEKQAREMADKVSMLEGKVQQLQMENKWLKGLITDKHDGKSLEEMRKEREDEERSTEDRKDGVGTAAAVAAGRDVKDEL